MNLLTPENIIQSLTLTFKGLKVINTWGEISLFYNPTNKHPHGIYFCTIKQKDSKYDQASNLNRTNTFRFNFAISKKKFIQIFQNIPKRPTKGKIIEGEYDFALINKLQPHPIYGWMRWVAIVNPTQKSFNTFIPLLRESYEKAKRSEEKKLD